MAENPIIRRNEEHTNQIVARVMLYCLPFFPLILVLNILGVFTVPLGQYLVPFGTAIILMVLPTFLITQRLSGPWFKYVVVTACTGAVTALYLNYWEIGRFIEILWLFPVVIACAYVSPTLTAYAAFASLLMMDIGYVYAISVKPVYYTEYVTVHNTFGDLAFRDVTLMAITVSLFGLTSRFRRLLNDLVSTEEQNVILSRLARIMGEATNAARSLVTSADRVAEIVQHSDAASTQTAEFGKQLAVSAEETLRYIRRAGPAIVEMADKIQGLAATVQEVARAAEEMDRTARSGKEALAKATDQMRAIEHVTEDSRALVDRLGERSVAIGQIVRVITNIARQTKLLALNASIEAARAGEEGRGFQVVAMSIRDLAMQSAQAAETITGLIAEIQEQTVQTVKAIDRGGEQIKSGLSAIGSVEEAFNQVAASEESVRGQVDRIAGTLTGLAASGDLIVSSAQGIEARNVNGVTGAQSIAAAMQQQLADMRLIRDELNRLLETAETLRTLGGN
ncbi:MAG: methyl-accepting chemotaxis protein [Bacteroidota bacterium]